MLTRLSFVKKTYCGMIVDLDGSISVRSMHVNQNPRPANRMRANP